MQEFIHTDIKVSFELLGYPNWNPKVTNDSDNESNASVTTRQSADSRAKQPVGNGHKSL